MSIRYLTGMAAAVAMMGEAQGAYYEPVRRREPKPYPTPNRKKRAKVKAARKQRRRQKSR